MRLVGARLLRAFFNSEQTLLDVMIKHRFTKVALLMYLMYYPNRNMWRARGFRDSTIRGLSLAQISSADFN